MDYTNKKCIVRADRAGVFFGTVLEKNGEEVVLKDARKLHYWSGASSVEEIAMIGTKRPNDCRFTVVVPLIGVEGVCQVLPCTEESIAVIESVEQWTA